MKFKEIEMKKIKEISFQDISFQDIEDLRPQWVKADNITENEVINFINEWLNQGNEYNNPLSFYKFITELKVTPPLQTPPVTPRLQPIDENTELSDIS